VGESEKPWRVEVLANNTAADVFGGVPPHVRRNGGVRGLGNERVGKRIESLGEGIGGREHQTEWNRKEKKKNEKKGSKFIDEESGDME